MLIKVLKELFHWCLFMTEFMSKHDCRSGRKSHLEIVSCSQIQRVSKVCKQEQIFLKGLQHCIYFDRNCLECLELGLRVEI